MCEKVTAVEMWRLQLHPVCGATAATACLSLSACTTPPENPLWNLCVRFCEAGRCWPSILQYCQRWLSLAGFLRALPSFMLWQLLCQQLASWPFNACQPVLGLLQACTIVLQPQVVAAAIPSPAVASLFTCFQLAWNGWSREQGHVPTPSLYTDTVVGLYG